MENKRLGASGKVGGDAFTKQWCHGIAKTLDELVREACFEYLEFGTLLYYVDLEGV